MRVQIKCNVDARMAKSLTHHRWMDFRLKHKRGMSVAQVMEPLSN